MFVMVEKGPGAFSLRFVCNEDVLTDLRAQGALDTFLTDVESSTWNFASALKIRKLANAETDSRSPVFPSRHRLRECTA